MNESKLIPFKTPDPELFNLRVGAILSPDNLVILAGLKSLEDEDTPMCQDSCRLN